MPSFSWPRVLQLCATLLTCYPMAQGYTAVLSAVCPQIRRTRARMATLRISAAGEVADLLEPCADCSLLTGNYFETLLQVGHVHWQGGTCLAATRVPAETWAPGQRTPLRTFCETRYGACHFLQRRPQLYTSTTG